MKEIFYSDGNLKIKQYDSKEDILEKGWYYWEETLVDYSGPYETEDIAKRELKRYGEFLSSEPKINP